MSGRRTALVIILVVAWTLLWVQLHPATPLHPGSDVYEQLTVARHLVAGDGFLNDIAYPLSAAFPFAAHLPQPLIHRPPGYSLLLIPAVMLGDNPEGILDGVRIQQILLLGLIVLVGVVPLARRGRLDTILVWLSLLMVNPLLDMGVRWGLVEIAVALVLILLWHRPQTDGLRSGLTDGLLAAVVALLRLELLWLPWLWLTSRSRPSKQWWLGAVTVWIVLMAPWAVRNVKVSGDPFFSLQAHAEHRKGTPEFSTSSPYQSLSPENFITTLERTPQLILRKTVSGVRYQARHLNKWLSWPLLIAGMMAMMAMVAARVAQRRRSAQQVAHQASSRLLLLGGSLGLCVVLYAPLSHDPRHLLPLFPVLSLELVTITTALISAMTRSSLSRWATLAAFVILMVGLFPARMSGWDQARNDAAATQAQVDQAVLRIEAMPPGPLFTDQAATLWFADRTGMMMPAIETDISKLRALVPELANAGVVILEQFNLSDERQDKAAE